MDTTQQQLCIKKINSYLGGQCAAGANETRESFIFLVQELERLRTLNEYLSKRNEVAEQELEHLRQQHMHLIEKICQGYFAENRFENQGSNTDNQTHMKRG